MDYSIKILNKTYRCKSIADARDLWNEIRESKGFGASRQCGADVLKGGKVVARVSYNGRVWEPVEWPHAKELSV